MRLAIFLALFAAAPAAAVETTLATGVVKKVEMGYQWVGWVLVNVTTYKDAGIQPILKVTLADGTEWTSCYSSSPDENKCVTHLNTGGWESGQANYVKCMLVEYALNNETSMAGNIQHQTVRKLNPHLALLSMAGLKALPVQLKDLGGHPNFLAAKCFDSVVVCFGGTCN